MRRAARVDSNQAAIVKALRKAGASVQVIRAENAGCPDLAVGWRGSTVLMEVKQPREQLRTEQAEWIESWRGAACVVRSEVEALAALGIDARRHPRLQDDLEGRN